MSTVLIRQSPTKASGLSFEDLYDEISEDWEHKALALQERRWRALKRELKGA